MDGIFCTEFEKMRPKTFDESEALESAMLQFWESGFEGSSMQDLVDRMGISRQSLYDTYGNKRELFEASLTRYRDEVIQPRIDQLDDPSTRPLDAIGGYLAAIAEGAGNMPLGCLVVRTATEISPRDAVIGRMLDECVRDVRAALIRALERGQACGDFDRGRSAEDLAGTVIAMGMGLHVMRRLPDTGRHVRPSIDAMLKGLTPA